MACRVRSEARGSAAGRGGNVEDDQAGGVEEDMNDVGAQHAAPLLRPSARVQPKMFETLPIQQRADADPDSPIPVVADQVGLVGGARHEIRVPVEPYGDHLPEPLPYTDLARYATVLGVVGPCVRIPYVPDPGEDLGATRGRHVVDEPHVERPVAGAVLRGVRDVHLDRQEGERVHAHAPTESERIADGERVVGVDIGSEPADLERASFLGSCWKCSGAGYSDNEQ